MEASGLPVAVSQTAATGGAEVLLSAGGAVQVPSSRRVPLKAFQMQSMVIPTAHTAVVPAVISSLVPPPPAQKPSLLGHKGEAHESDDRH